jgi:hypothetical protein
MAVMIDYIGSAILFGMLILAVARVQTNLNSSMYETNFSTITQRNATEFARQLEFDLVKIGYRAAGEKVILADSTSIQYRADVSKNGVVHTVRYHTGTTDEAASSINPRDFPIYRTDNNGTTTQLWGVTEFRFRYFDSLGVQLPTPVDSVGRRRIRSVNARFRIESPEAVITLFDTTYNAVSWEKLIFPRNLTN